LLTVLADRNLAATMGHRGRNRVKADFSWAGAAAQVQEVVTTIVTAPSALAGDAPR
jgi:hypothetical protein